MGLVYKTGGYLGFQEMAQDRGKRPEITDCPCTIQAGNFQYNILKFFRIVKAAKKGVTMSIPDYQAIMLPLLNTLASGKSYSIHQLISELSEHFKLTESEQNALLDSRKQTVFSNRMHWAKTYLKKAGLIEQVDRGVIKISERGKKVLADKPVEISKKSLMEFPEFVDFQKRARTTLEDHKAEVPEAETPYELLERSYLSLRKNLVIEILETIKKYPSEFFEKLVVDLLVSMGYGGSFKDAGKAIGKSGDDGIDGIIKEDKLGLDIIAIQAKRWEQPVGRPLIQAFAGSLDGVKAKKGVFITTSKFTEAAYDYASKIEKKIILIDGEMLAEYMIDFNVGVAEESKYIIKKINLDYFQQ